MAAVWREQDWRGVPFVLQRLTSFLQWLPPKRGKRRRRKTGEKTEKEEEKGGKEKKVKVKSLSISS